ncbi:4-diphosphocytidyl-2-methyl-D-erithritol synthase [Candidatus Scalindua japonica]|uniref:2-C-methyl-D-erythritol 4-phosphate cytidylyltransferase n=2 Tax=Candidatus Scalindua japonica TaxID=1284222 RepID=A0A286U0U3_9BACT|nr:4-diphosphocytidyl-2-methyl-D-erithritol synthase [Candidatus Scalindua japonica]
MEADVSVIMPAAGLSLRMGAGVRKPFIMIGEKPIFFYTLEKFCKLERVKEIIFVVNEKDRSTVIEKWSDALKEYKVTKIVTGGERRMDSIYNGLSHLDPDTEIVLIHDAVRPLVKSGEIEAVIKSAEEKGAAILASPMKLTVKQVNSNLEIIKTIPRHDLWMAQTPQGFKRDLLVNAYDGVKGTNEEFTDDAEVVEKAGHTVGIVSGSYDNIKITTREDLKLAESLLVKC